MIDRSYIYKKAKNLGADIVGFTNCDSLSYRKEYLIERKKEGKITEFEEKDILKRISPKLELENCKSIITLGVSYNLDLTSQDKDKIKNIKFKGNLSKSSWGEDYHKVLKDIMLNLVLELKRKKDFDYKIIVDTGPLIDREIAYKSGIGYYGKNCSIINKEYGSFIFIGYILSSLELDIKSEIIENECGDCRICIDSCPTNALESDYKINPKKCISYLTQTKEYISDDLKDKMGNSIYGCDICQMACPKNKDVFKSSNMKFYPKKTLGILDIEKILNMSNKTFKKEYGHMAGAWRGKGVIYRNSIIILGNQRKNKTKALELLYNEMEKGNIKYKDYIIWAINKLEKSR